MRATYSLFLLFILMVPLSTIQSQSKRDSLLLLLEQAAPGERTELLLEVGDTYYNQDIEVYRSYVDSALSESDQLTDRSVLVRINHYKGDYYDRVGKYDSAILQYQRVVEISKELQDDVATAKALSEIGLVYYKTGKYDLSAEYLFESINSAEKANHKQTIATCYGYLGHLNYGQKKFREAIKYHKIGKEIHKQLGDASRVATADVNIGNNYHQLEILDSALYHLNLALKQFELEKDTLSQSYPINNMALVYMDQENYDKSIEYLKRGLEIRLKYDEPRGICFGYNYLGFNYRKIGDFERAIEHYEKSIEYARPIDYLLLMESSYEGLALCYEALGDFQKAYNYQKELNVLSDSLFSRDKTEALADAQTKFETAKKEQEIALQASIIKQNELSLQRNQALIIALVILVLALVLLGLFYYKRQQYRQQLLLEAERNQLKAAQIKAVIQSQEEERKRFAMDLHDDFGQMISALRIQSNHKKVEPTIRENMNGQLDQMYKSLKTIAFNLMPQTLLERGLVDALDELCLQLTNMSDMAFQFHAFEAEEQLGDDQKVAVYRIIQEVVNNIIKYANANKVTISLTGHQDALSVMIEDDGEGFDVETFKTGKGNGWKNIQSRLELLNGDISFDTTPGRKASTVVLDVPLRVATAKAA